jgi:hypothetical protein
MGQARTALSLTAAGSPLHGASLSLSRPPRRTLAAHTKNARHRQSGDGHSVRLSIRPDQAA